MSTRKKKGAKTPLRTPPATALTPNDDAREMAENRFIRERQAIRDSIGGKLSFDGEEGAGAELAMGSITGATLEEMFRRCIALANENKINRRNAWDLRLINHLPELVRSAKQHGEQQDFSFQQASATLDAGVQIYAKRVDSVYHHVYETLQGITKRDGTGDSVEEGGSGGEEEEEGLEASSGAGVKETAASKKRKGTKQATPSATLAQLEDVTLQPADEAVATAASCLSAPLRSCTDFGGWKTLRLCSSRVYAGAALAANPTALPGRLTQPLRSGHVAPVVAPAALQSACDRLLAEMPSSSMELTPSISQLRMLAGVEAAADGSAAAAAQLVEDAAAAAFSQAPPASAAPSGADADAPMMSADCSAAAASAGTDSVEEPDDSCFVGDDPGNDDSDMLADDSAEVRSGRLGAPSQDGSGQAHGPASSGVGSQLELVHPLAQLLPARAQRRPPQGKWQFAPLATAAPRAKAPRKRAGGLDFCNLPELPKAWDAPASRPSDICLARSSSASAPPAAAAAPSGPGPACRFQLEDFLQLCTWPQVELGPLLSRTADPVNDTDAAAADAAADEYGVEETGDDAGDWGSDDGGEGCEVWEHSADAPQGGKLQLIEAPQRVRPACVKYSRVNRQVDMLALTRGLWSVVSDLAAAGSPAAPQEQAPPPPASAGEGHKQLPEQRGATEEGGVDFAAVLQHVSSAPAAGPPAADSKEEVSVHLCFLSLLFLANRHELALESQQPGHVRIQLPQSLSRAAPAIAQST